jgi:hypothetical protein
MEYPPAVIDKAKKQEKLLQARAAGKSLAEACAISGIATILSGGGGFCYHIEYDYWQA